MEMLESNISATSHSAFSAAGQYLTFLLGGEEYGLDILRVQEIKGWEPATWIPNTPEYIQGVINLRGHIIPIVDLRRRFQLEHCDILRTTVIVVVKVILDGGERTVGFVVDAVSDVYHIGEEQIQLSSDLGSVVNSNAIWGIARQEDKMIILVQVDDLINFELLASTEASFKAIDKEKPSHEGRQPAGKPDNPEFLSSK